MINYALLYKDETSQVSYFYNLDTHVVYTDRNPINQKIITKWSLGGALVAVLLYPLLGIVQKWHIAMPMMTSLIVSLGGIGLGWIVSMLLIKRNESYFTEGNKLDVRKDEIRSMYIAGKDFRKKYRLLLSILFVFDAISTIILCNIAVSTVLLIMLIALWVIEGIMYFSNRPICSMKLKRIMK